MLSAIFGAKIQKGIVSFRILTFACISQLFDFFKHLNFDTKSILGAKIQMRHFFNIWIFAPKIAKCVLLKTNVEFLLFFALFANLKNSLITTLSKSVHEKVFLISNYQLTLHGSKVRRARSQD